MIEVMVLVLALLAGLFARWIRLPSMVGFLAAGFAIPFLQVYLPELQSLDLQPVADVGITVLLFTIGLKLDLGSLVRPFIWAVTCLNMSIIMLIVCVAFFVLKSLGWVLLASLSFEQSLTIGFALSFSSTVFAVKMLEDRGEMASMHGKAAVGILVMQDILAVAYLSMAGDVSPSPFAPAVLLLIPARNFLHALLRRCGHGELLVLAGFAVAYSAYALFEWAGLKGGLGALFVGALLAKTEKGNELAKSLMMIKNLLLIGFFLSIGQYGLPSDEAWLMAIALTLLLIVKPLIYFFLLILFNLRAQTALFGALALNHYSEFGLIVTAIAIQEGNLPEQWVVILALALSFSFMISSMHNLYSNNLYARLHTLLSRLQRNTRIPEQQAIDIGQTEILIMGMGRLGTGAYDYLRSVYGDTLLGFEENASKAAEHRRCGRNVLVGDASDWDLWQRLPHQQVSKIILTLSNHRETVLVANMLRKCGYTGVIATVAKFDDHLQELKDMGVIAFNFYAEAGAGFAKHMVKSLENNTPQPAKNI